MTIDRLFDRGSIVPTEEERAASRSELLELFARQNQPTGKLRKTTIDATERLSGKLVDAIIDSGWENAELLALRENLATLLTRTANALKGDPPPLTSWSWHDLPDVAGEGRRLRDEIARTKAMLTNLADELEAPLEDLHPLIRRIVEPSYREIATSIRFIRDFDPAGICIAIPPQEDPS